jgi:hypothetical protein
MFTRFREIERQAVDLFDVGVVDGDDSLERVFDHH